MIFMSVNTPTKTKGEGKGYAADLTYVRQCAETIAKISKTNKIVVEKSTLPVKTAEMIKETLNLNKKQAHLQSPTLYYVQPNTAVF